MAVYLNNVWRGRILRRAHGKLAEPYHAPVFPVSEMGIRVGMAVSCYENHLKDVKYMGFLRTAALP